MISRRDALKLGAGAAGVAVTGAAAFLWLGQDDNASRAPSSGTAVPGDREIVASPTPTGSRTGVETEVDDDGFDITLGPIHVFAPAGVAASGTRISVSDITEPPSPELLAMAGAIGPRVMIELGDGDQPQQPITIEVSLAGTDLANAVSDEAPLVALSRTGSEESFLLLDGVLDTERTVFTVVTDHLSPFEFFQFNLEQFVVDLLLDLVDARFPRPGGAYDPLTIGATTYSVDQSDNLAVWPVLREQQGRLAVELHSNSPLPWAVQTTPPLIGSLSGHYTDRNIGIAAYYQGLHSIFGNERTAVMPGTVATFQFSQDMPPTSMALRIDQALFLVTSVLWVFESILRLLASTPKAQALLATYEGLGCIIEIVKTPDQIGENRNFTGLVRSAAACIGTLVQENAGKLGSRFFVRTIATVVGIVIGGASIIAAAVANVLFTVTGNNAFTLAFHATGGTAERPTEATSGFRNDVPMVGGNASRTGEMPGPAPRLDAQIQPLWEYRARSSYIHSPVYADGVVYASSYPSALQAIDADTGDELWRTTFDGNVEASPAVLDGTVYVCSGDSRNFAKDSAVHALDASSGTEKWRFTPQQEVVFSPCIQDGMVYVTSRWHLINALDASSGRVIWSHDTKGEFDSSPSVSNGVVYAGGKGEGIDADGVMWAFDARTGAVRWTQPGRRWISSLPVVRNGLVYVSCGDDYLYALDAESGSEQWRFYDEGAIRYTAPAVNGQVLVAAGADGYLFGLDPATGAERWRTESDQFFGDATPVLVDGIVFIPRNDDHLVALDSTTGSELWRIAIDSPKPPAVIDGRIFIPGRDTLYALGNGAA